ncbi:hypothetical protein B4Q13_19690, partial [Lacticaseibacillus rhamnosus]
MGPGRRRPDRCHACHARVSSDWTAGLDGVQGIDDLTVGGFSVFNNGAFVPGSHTTPLGNELNFVSFDPATGQVTYTYTLVNHELHANGNGANDLFENLPVVLTDTDG